MSTEGSAPEWRERNRALRQDPEFRARLAAAVSAGYARKRALRSDEELEARRQANAAKSRKQTYLVISPDGSTETVTDLKAFCTEHGLSYNAYMHVLSGRQKAHRGYIVEHAPKEDLCRTQS